MKPAISVENLSKLYRINLQKRRLGQNDLRETLTDLIKAPFHRLRHGASHAVHTKQFWALKDVSFNVYPGEVLGVIGRNGAGKSTLLKILSRITDPTSGMARIRGRVGSLLEVGTGFHPDLTGRENVYLNGAILGMSRAEIRQKFDAIADFAGIDTFLDTPVKRYSSGMRVRLGFAVAAHLDPEILIVDEVLAVGDAEFQKRCLGKMQDVAGSGRTVLFVSHSMTAVHNLCSRVIVLRQGEIIADADADAALRTYMSDLQQGGSGGDVSQIPRERQYRPIIQSITLLDADGNPVSSIAAGDPLTIKIKYANDGPAIDPGLGIGLDTELGHRLCWLDTKLQGGDIENLPPEGTAYCTIPALALVPGTYSLTFSYSSAGEQLDRLENVVQLSVEPSDYYGTGQLPNSSQGHLLIPAHWNISSRPVGDILS